MQYFSMRQDVFDVIVAFEKKGLDGLSAEEKRYVERMIKYGRRNGMELRKTDTIIILSLQTDGVCKQCRPRSDCSQIRVFTVCCSVCILLKLLKFEDDYSKCLEWLTLMSRIND